MAEEVAPVGAERDAQVAEVVFGYVRHYTALHGQNGERLYEWHTTDGMRAHLEQWSTDPHCAWKVVLEMKRQGCDMSMSWPSGWRCLIWIGRGEKGGRALDADLAAAITSAALRAKMQEAKG